MVKIKLEAKLTEMFLATLGVMKDRNLFCGIQLIAYLLDEVIMNSYWLGYFNYSCLVGEFGIQVNPRLFEALHVTLQQLLNGFIQGDRSRLRLVGEAFEVYTKFLHFPFENTYVTFSTDIDLSDHSSTAVPVKLAPFIFDRNFLTAVENFCLSREVSEETRTQAIGFLSKQVSCKLDIAMPEEAASEYVKFHMLFLSKVLSLFDQLGRSPGETNLDLLLDHVGRLFRLLRVSKLLKHKEEMTVLLNSFVLLSRIILVKDPQVHSAQQLDGKSVRCLMMVWNLIIDQTSYHTSELVSEGLEKLFVQYLEVYFSPESRLDSFQGIDCLDDELFEKMVAKRFKTLREIFGTRKETLLDPLIKLNSCLHSEASVGRVSHQRLMHLLNAGSNEAVRVLQPFLSKYLHFLIFGSYLYFANNNSGYGYHYYLNSVNQYITSLTSKDLDAVVNRVQGEFLGLSFGMVRTLLGALTSVPDVRRDHTGRVLRDGVLRSELLLDDMHEEDGGESGH